MRCPKSVLFAFLSALGVLKIIATVICNVYSLEFFSPIVISSSR
jgi:hypothetical protein